MKTTFRWLHVIGLCIILPIKVWSKVCTGGYRCTAPHECCAQGCCLYVPSSAYNPINNNNHSNNVDDIYFFNPPVKVYLWVLVLMVAASVAAAWCYRWRGCRRGCWPGGSPASEPDSAGSCYYPPQYSRCGSLCRSGAQPAPPPYNEVTSKPDLYPMVIYLGADKGDGDIMVQYFKNYIVRPPGSLSAASTADSISSSYICNTANEANTIIPPPYSCAGSVEWSCLPAASVQRQALLRSISSVTCQEYSDASPRRSLQHSSSGHVKTSDINSVLNSNSVNDIQDCENSEPIAQTSTGNTHCHAKHTNQASASNSKTYKIIPMLPSSPRIYTHDVPANANNNPNAANHQYFNIWEYNSTNREANSNDNNSYNINGNHSPKILTMNKYGSHSNDLLDEIEQSHNNIYIDYVNQNASRGLYNPNTKSINYHVTPSSNDRKNQTGNVKKDNNYPYPNNEYERDTPISNPNSLEENQFCTFFSCSIPEGVTCDNISGDYSISTKHLNNFGSKEDISRYSVGHSITGSEISSLANFGTPDSPPQATSPTSEMKVILDQIQQLPNQSNIQDECDENGSNDESYFTSDVTRAKRYFSKSRKNSLYMPLNLVPNSKTFHPGKTSPTSNTCFKRHFVRKGWLSRSAPTTPCGSGLVPNILTMPQINPTASSGRASRLSKTSHTTQADDSPLLTEQDASGDEMEQ